LRILLLDIETAPNLVHAWGLWDQNISINQIIESGYTLCYAAKWYNEEEVYFDSVFDNTPKGMLEGIHALMDEADAIIHYNGTHFDIPTLNKEFLLAGMSPPAPAKQIDLLRTARSQFKFPSNKLDYVATALGLEGKTPHKGHGLWVGCMNGSKEDWEIMEIYNINDVIILEQVYNKLKPWIKNHANHGLFASGGLVCPNCGGNHYQKRGFAYTHSGKYQRYQCNGCTNWFRAKKAEQTNVFVNVQ